MDATGLGGRLADAFGADVLFTAQSAKRLYVSLPPARLHEVFDWLQLHVPGLRYGTATAIDLREGIGVFHHLCVNETPLVITLKVIAPKPDPRIPSLAVKVSAANWIEREMTDLVGVAFEGHPDARRLVKAEAFPDAYPLRRDFDVAEFKEGIGERPDF